METLVKQLLQLTLFSAFIHAVIEVVKAISGVGLFGAVKEIVKTLVKNTYMSESTIKILVFALALVYCWAFDFGAMIDMLGVKIEDTNSIAWWLDYVGTSSVVFVGVDVFYQWVKKAKDSLSEKTT